MRPITHLQRVVLIPVLLLLTTVQPSMALELPNVFGTSMVIQRDLPIKVWGHAKAGSVVKVSIGDRNGQATVDGDGNWLVTLDALPVNDKPTTMIITGDDTTITFENILVGDVWICSGQSNMEWPVEWAENSAEEIANAADNLIRICELERTAAPTPQFDAAMKWDVCGPDTVKKFSAVGYFFGRHLRRELNVPIGLIDTNWGGTRAEAWTSHKALLTHEGYARSVESWKKSVESFPQRLADYHKKQKQYEDDLALWLTNNPGKTAKDATHLKAPKQPGDPGTYRNSAGMLFNAMIHPLVPLGIKGAIWYQGEANAGRGDEYRELLPLMIKDWREHWGQGDFPFGIVQLANYRSQTDKPSPKSGWARLRDAQRHTSLTVHNTGMAVIIDIGDAKNIHPKNKQDVGKRLGLWALHDVYKTIDKNWTGPVYDSFKVDGNKITLTFKEVDGKLITRDGNAPAEFAICGSDEKWVWAQTQITSDNTITVWADGINEPVAVRYAWADNPINPNLTDSSQLPASPFRTDDWTNGK